MFQTWHVLTDATEDVEGSKAQFNPLAVSIMQSGSHLQRMVLGAKASP
jgi:hypothetical protein